MSKPNTIVIETMLICYNLFIVIKSIYIFSSLLH